ncbi:MAG: hypothetical protein Q7T66_17470 [Herminiimonas sp.]|uniref:hypothetical protein n=1 Tax=Herminiimonas sp. TaxID=1926289 RepID=UPI0027275B55|nr:hypothetical protein [Herminiimonas sp.]MDO9422454.1 hypothetical protein [Herminiimonas sp.]
MPKLPTSLNWLINRRGRIDGSIQKIERYLDKHRRAFEKFQELSNELSFLKETLVSIDTTMRLHKLQIDPQNIPTINGKNYLTDLPRGEITLLIYERVKMGGGEPVCSKEIVEHILAYRKATGASPIPSISLSLMVSRRMNGLCRKGRLVRHHPQKTGTHGLWTLCLDSSQDIQPEVGDPGHIP